MLRGRITISPSNQQIVTVEGGSLLKVASTQRESSYWHLSQDLSSHHQVLRHERTGTFLGLDKASRPVLSETPVPVSVVPISPHVDGGSLSIISHPSLGNSLKIFGECIFRINGFDANGAPADPIAAPEKDDCPSPTSSNDSFELLPQSSESAAPTTADPNPEDSHATESTIKDDTADTAHSATSAPCSAERSTTPPASPEAPRTLTYADAAAAAAPTPAEADPIPHVPAPQASSLCPSGHPMRPAAVVGRFARICKMCGDPSRLVVTCCSTACDYVVCNDCNGVLRASMGEFATAAAAAATAAVDEDDVTVTVTETDANANTDAAVDAGDATSTRANDDVAVSVTLVQDDSDTTGPLAVDVEVSCPSGHPLVRLVQPHRTTCDLCRQDMNPMSVVARCVHPCDYDVCVACADRLNIPDPSAAAAAATTTSDAEAPAASPSAASAVRSLAAAAAAATATPGAAAATASGAASSAAAAVATLSAAAAAAVAAATAKAKNTKNARAARKQEAKAAKAAAAAAAIGAAAPADVPALETEQSTSTATGTSPSNAVSPPPTLPVPTPSGPTCPSGHVVSVRMQPVEVVCDLCGRMMRCGSTVVRCADVACDYDLCTKCGDGVWSSFRSAEHDAMARNASAAAAAAAATTTTDVDAGDVPDVPAPAADAADATPTARHMPAFMATALTAMGGREAYDALTSAARGVETAVNDAVSKLVAGGADLEEELGLVDKEVVEDDESSGSDSDSDSDSDSEADAAVDGDDVTVAAAAAAGADATDGVVVSRWKKEKAAKEEEDATAATATATATAKLACKAVARRAAKAAKRAAKLKHKAQKKEKKQQEKKEKKEKKEKQENKKEAKMAELERVLAQVQQIAEKASKREAKSAAAASVPVAAAAESADGTAASKGRKDPSKFKMQLPGGFWLMGPSGSKVMVEDSADGLVVTLKKPAAQ